MLQIHIEPLKRKLRAIGAEWRTHSGTLWLHAQVEDTSPTILKHLHLLLLHRAGSTDAWDIKSDTLHDSVKFETSMDLSALTVVQQTTPCII